MLSDIWPAVGQSHSICCLTHLAWAARTGSLCSHWHAIAVNGTRSLTLRPDVLQLIQSPSTDRKQNKFRLWSSRHLSASASEDPESEIWGRNIKARPWQALAVPRHATSRCEPPQTFGVAGEAWAIILRETTICRGYNLISIYINTWQDSHLF